MGEFNHKRALWAQKALSAFQRETGCEDDEALPDLLCNLMHLSDFERWDFKAMLARAESNFEAEKEENE